jgi:hypothetical protein
LLWEVLKNLGQRGLRRSSQRQPRSLRRNPFPVSLRRSFATTVEDLEDWMDLLKIIHLPPKRVSGMADKGPELQNLRVALTSETKDQFHATLMEAGHKADPGLCMYRFAIQHYSSEIPRYRIRAKPNLVKWLWDRLADGYVFSTVEGIT